MFDPAVIRPRIEALMNNNNPNNPNFENIIRNTLTGVIQQGIIGKADVFLEDRKLTVCFTRPTRSISPEPIIVHMEIFEW